MMENPEWVIGFRTDVLTFFFKLFPFFASEYFYIMTAAMLYWLRPQNKQIIQLGFIIAVTAMLNGILKNIFCIPRPHLSMHLVEVKDSFGFPSGDVQTAVVFWGVIWSLTRNLVLRCICVLVVLCIFMSRVYLGVHSIYDVIGGLLFGMVILKVWQSNWVQHKIMQWFKGDTQSFWWFIAITIGLYTILSYGRPWLPLASVVVGALLGYGLSIPTIARTHQLPLEPINTRKIISSLICMVCTIILVKMLPMLNINAYILNLSIICKYVVIIMFVYYGVPHINKRLKF